MRRAKSSRQPLRARPASAARRETAPGGRAADAAHAAADTPPRRTRRALPCPKASFISPKRETAKRSQSRSVSSSLAGIARQGLTRASARASAHEQPLEDAAVDAPTSGSRSATRTRSLSLWIVALTGPSSTTSAQMSAMKRPSDVPPVHDSSGVTAGHVADRRRSRRRPAGRAASGTACPSRSTRGRTRVRAAAAMASKRCCSDSRVLSGE